MGKRQFHLFIGERPLAIGKMVVPENLESGLGKIPERKNEKELSFQHSVSFDVPKSEELMKLKKELEDRIERRYSEWMQKVDVAARKILTEYIDDPFTTDPSKATKEEFEKRHISLVFQNTEDGAMNFAGVLQGTTLIRVDGTRIENFGKK